MLKKMRSMIALQLALVLSAKNAAALALRRIGNGVYKVENRVRAWNVDGSASHKPKTHGSWIGFYKEKTGSAPSLCSYQGCTCDTLVGGHVWINQFGGPFIAPICRKCNSPKNQMRLQHAYGMHSFLRAGTLVIRVPFTNDMKLAKRRIRQ